MYYLYTNKSKKKLPTILKRNWAAKLESLNAYQVHKYKNAGVREYWVVDHKNKTVIVHRLEDEDYKPEIYGFDAVIPVGISGGKCSIDFSRVLRRLTKA